MSWQPAPLSFGQRLRLLLAVYNLRANELAQRADLDDGYLSRILSGRQSCPPATAARLLRALHRDELDVSVARVAKTATVRG